MFTLKFLHLQLGNLLFFLKIQFVAFFLDLFPHKFNILSLCDSYVVLRPVHAFYGEVASNAVNKSNAGVQDFQDRAWGKVDLRKIFPEYPKNISRIHENISQIKRNICWNSMTGPEKKMSDVRSPKQKYLPEFIFLSFFWEDPQSTYFINIQNKFRAKYHGLLNHKETPLEWPTEMDIWSISKNTTNLK